MSALRILALLALTAEFSSSQRSDCSYFGLLKHLNLATTNHLLSITRPVWNWTTPTYVKVDMLLYGILKVIGLLTFHRYMKSVFMTLNPCIVVEAHELSSTNDEKAQTITSHIWLQTSWPNEFLTWNKTDFCGIDSLSIPTSLLWIPDVTIQEDASDTGSIFRSPLAKLYSNGFIITSARQRLTTTCELGLRMFPFDKQDCNFTFASMTSDATTVQMGAFNNGSVLTRFSEQYMVTFGEWKLKKMEISNEYVSSGQSAVNKLVYRVTIERKPMLHVINFIVPLFYLLVLDLASFFIHEARGEKLSFKVTVLLSISVLLLILKDMLPSTEERLPLIASYCVSIFGMVGMSVLEAILVSFLIDLDGYYGRKAQRSALEENQPEVDQLKELAGAEEKVQVKPDESYLPLDGPSNRDLMKQILEEVKVARQEAERQNKDFGVGRYRRAAEIIDAVFFVLYFLAVVTFLTYMYSVWIYNVNDTD